METKNVENLRNDLLKVYDGLRKGKIGLDEAKQAANVSGKIIGSVKIQIQYNKMVQSKERIPFMEL